MAALTSWPPFPSFLQHHSASAGSQCGQPHLFHLWLRSPLRRIQESVLVRFPSFRGKAFYVLRRNWRLSASVLIASAVIYYISSHLLSPVLSTAVIQLRVNLSLAWSAPSPRQDHQADGEVVDAILLRVGFSARRDNSSDYSHKIQPVARTVDPKTPVSEK